MLAGRLAGKRILVVEDDYFIASDLRRALQREDATVLGPVGRLTDAVAILDGGALDAAVLDVNLGRETTVSLAERLASDAVPSLFVTGYDDWSMLPAHRDAPRVTKPFKDREVLDALSSIIARETSS